MASKPEQFLTPDAQLMDLVIRGNVDLVRQYFNEGLTGQEYARPTWAHLKIATTQNNAKMAKLLVTWGASPNREELAALIKERPMHAESDIRLLKLAGVNVTNVDLNIAAPVFNKTAERAPQERTLELDFENIPGNWKIMLLALSLAGAEEAVIAGGALRDLYNGRKIGSVDVFIKAPFMQKSFMKQLADYNILARTQRDAKGRLVKFLPVKKRLGAQTTERYMIGDPLDRTDTWQIIDREGTTFNIIMLGSDLGGELRKSYKEGNHRKGIANLLSRFDFGLCQIACNMHSVITTDAYNRDAQKRTLTLRDPLATTAEHVAAMISKYPDYTPNDKLAAILKAGKVPPRPVPPVPIFSSRAYM